MELQSFFTDILLPFTTYLTIGGFVLILLFAIYQTAMGLASDPGTTSKGLIGFAVFAVVLFILYSVASGDKTGVFKASQYKDLTGQVMKFVTFGVFSAIVFAVFAALSALVLEVINWLK